MIYSGKCQVEIFLFSSSDRGSNSIDSPYRNAQAKHSERTVCMALQSNR